MSLTNRGRLHTRFTVENCQGAWPGDNKYNCPLGYAAPDPTLWALDRWSTPKGRWVDVGAGGFEDIVYEVKEDVEFLKISSSGGKVKGDGSADSRVWLSVDWAKFPADLGKATGKATFTSSDGAKVVITVPVNNHPRPPSNFHGAVQGDGYIVFEAEHFQGSTPGKAKGLDYAWEVVPDYGRTLSGMTVYPLTSILFEPTEGPSLAYDFWLTDVEDAALVDIILHIGPSLNFILGQKLAFALQLDEGDTQTIYPVPDSPLGSLPADWEDIVAAEIRVVTASLQLGGKGVGAHRLVIWALGVGVVLERVMIDLGGIAGRGESYLGPPESFLL